MNLTDLNNLAAQWAPCMLRACWQGALAVVAVWGICRLFPRLPSSLRTVLWWLACLKTLVSLAITGPISLAVLPTFASPPPLAATSSTAIAHTSFSGATGRGSILSVMAAFPETATSNSAVHNIRTVSPSQSRSFSPLSIVLCLWLAMVVFLAVAFCRELRAIRRIASQADPCDESTTVQEVAHAIGLTHSPPVLVSERTDCSLVVGPWCPAVVLCRADLESLSAKELRALLAHELAHIRRRDLWAGILPNLARLLFFFDPLVWLACREYDLAREATCDTVALRVSGLTPADYGRLLLKLSITSSVPLPFSPLVTLSATSPYARLLRRRLHGLRKLGNSSPALPRWSGVLALAVTVFTLSLNPVRVGAGPVPGVRPTTLPPGVMDHPVANSVRVSLWKSATEDVVQHRAAPVTAAASPTVPRHPLMLSSRAASPKKGTQSTTFVTSHLDLNNQKEDKPMSILPNGRKPNLSMTLAAVALAVAPTSFAAAQDTPPAPVPPPPAVAPSAPVAPVEVAASSLGVAPVAPPDAHIAPQPTPVLRYQYTLRRGDSYMNHTQDNAVATAQRALAKAQPGDCLVVDRAGRRYLITDVDTLRRIQENFAPVDALGKQMETLGKQMEAFSKPMEDLGKQMEAKGKVMEGIGQKMEEQGKLLEAAFNEGKPEADRKAIQDQMHALQEQMKVPQEEMQALSKQMRDQGGKMHPLGDQMREFGRQMRVIAKEAQEKMSGIIDTAFANNLAVEQKAP